MRQSRGCRKKAFFRQVIAATNLFLLAKQMPMLFQREGHSKTSDWRYRWKAASTSLFTSCMMAPMAMVRARSGLLVCPSASRIFSMPLVMMPVV